MNQATKTGVTSHTFAYDDQGRRVRKTVGSTTTNYLYNGPDIVAEYGSNWTSLTSLLTHGPNMDDPLIRASLTGSQYYHQDGLGSVVGLTNQNGGTDGTARYDAWGNKIASTGTVPLYGYTGREPDDTGLIYYRARYYDPTVGRFTQRDPLGMADGINRYAYVRNNPVNLVDPLGLTANPSLTNAATQTTSYYNTLSDFTPTFDPGGQAVPSFPGLTSGQQSLANQSSANFSSNTGTNDMYAAAAGAQGTATDAGGAQAQFDRRTENILAGLHPEVAALASGLLTQAREAGLDARLVAGFRSYETQNLLYEQGRTAPGPIVTNARGGESYHNFGVAFDIALFDAKGRYITNGSDPAYQQAGKIGERLGLTWGGRWQNPVDPSHFQLDRGIDLATMRRRFEAGVDVFTGR